MLGIAPDPGGYTSQRARIHDSKTVVGAIEEAQRQLQELQRQPVRRAAADRQDGVRKDVKNIIKSITKRHK